MRERISDEANNGEGVRVIRQVMKEEVKGGMLGTGKQTVKEI